MKMNKNFAYIGFGRRFLFTIVILSVFFGSFHAACSAGLGETRKQEVKERTEKILSSSEFAEKEKEKTMLETMAVGVKDLVEKIKEKLRKLLDRINLPKMKAAPKVGKLDPTTSAVFKLVGIMIIIAAIIVVVYIISRNIRIGKKVRVKEDQELLVALRDANIVEERAFEFADKGDYRQAIRHLYIALLLKFNEFDLIRIEKSKTNKQYLYELKEADFKDLNTVYEFTHDFNRYWYGNRKADKEKFDYWNRNYDLLKKEVSQ